MLGLMMCSASHDLGQFQSALEDSVNSLVALRPDVETLHQVVEVSFVQFVEFFCCF